MASNNNNSRPTKHPLEKSLAIFPLVPRTQILVYNPVSSSLLSSASSLSCPSASSRRKRRKGASRSATTDFDRTNYTTSNQSFSGNNDIYSFCMCDLRLVLIFFLRGISLSGIFGKGYFLKIELKTLDK